MVKYHGCRIVLYLLLSYHPFIHYMMTERHGLLRLYDEVMGAPEVNEFRASCRRVALARHARTWWCGRAQTRERAHTRTRVDRRARGRGWTGQRKRG